MRTKILFFFLRIYFRGPPQTQYPLKVLQAKGPMRVFINSKIQKHTNKSKIMATGTKTKKAISKPIDKVEEFKSLEALNSRVNLLDASKRVQSANFCKLEDDTYTGIIQNCGKVINCKNDKFMTLVGIKTDKDGSTQFAKYDGLAPKVGSKYSFIVESGEEQTTDKGTVYTPKYCTLVQ